MPRYSKRDNGAPERSEAANSVFLPDFPPLLPVQKRILRDVHSGKWLEVLFSAPRGNGKSWIAGRAVADVIWPGSPYYEKGKECVFIARTFKQARLAWKFVHDWLEPTDEFSWQDSANQIGVKHKRDGTEARVISSKAASALGLGADQSLIIADEPGSWEPREGEAMQEALRESLGKPGSTCRVFWAGTVAPAKGAWWPEMVATGTVPGRKVHSWAANPDKWRHRREHRRVNPVAYQFKETRDIIDLRFAEAKKSPAAEASFKNWRLNCNVASGVEILLDGERLEALAARRVPARSARYWLGLDLGDNISFNAATAIYDNGRIECLAACAGIPDLAERERHDGKPRGTYKRLADAGLLHVIPNRRSVEPSDVVTLVRDTWGDPAKVSCDRFRERQLLDCKTGWKIEWRGKRWSESTYDIEAFRSGAADGPLSVASECLPLLAMSIADARVQPDDDDFVKMIKASTRRSRDDIAQSTVLASGLHKREGTSGGRLGFAL